MPSYNALFCVFKGVLCFVVYFIPQSDKIKFRGILRGHRGNENKLSLPYRGSTQNNEAFFRHTAPSCYDEIFFFHHFALLGSIRHFST